MTRELDDDAVSYQAEQLKAYLERGGRGGVHGWLASKDFSELDRAAILRAWARLDEGAA